MRRVLLFFLLGCGAFQAQQTSVPTALPSRPFFIENTWFIGGTGDWDKLTIDPEAARLYIAHSNVVQVVDAEAGTVAGEIAGFGDARDIVLDPSSGYGYVSDGARAQVTVFDRGTLQTVARIPTDPGPHALVFDPETKLLFAVCARMPAARARAAGSRVTVIDTVTRSVLGRILLPGTLGFASADENGQVFIDVTDRNAIVRFDAQSAATLLGGQSGATAMRKGAREPDAWPTLDWTGSDAAAAGHMHTFALGAECTNPTGLAVDSADMRLFAACGNMTMVVVNAGTGELVAALPVGPGADAVGYDSEHGHIFVANGGGDGSLTIVRRDVTDTYAVIQTLPTRRQARTLAVDSETGNVYLVTDYMGVSRSPMGGIGTLKQAPIEGSFQVLQIGN